MSFGWPVLLRKPLLWASLASIASMILLSVSLAVLIAVPGPWDGAIAIKVCGNLPIVQRRDGTVWLRSGWRAYRVENDDAWRLCP